MRGILHCCVSVVLLLSVAQAAPHEGHDHGPHQADHHHHLHHGKDEAHPQHDGGDAQCHKLMPHNADFAFALYKKLNALPDSKNVFFSPVAISMALSMLALGAKDETLTQLYSTLSYSSLTPAEVNEGYEHMLHMLGHGQEHMQLDTGAALAIGVGFKVLDKFLTDAKHYYESEAFSVDFSKPDVAVPEINKFIAKKTNNKITDMVTSLDPDTVMMLISYIHFRGRP